MRCRVLKAGMDMENYSGMITLCYWGNKNKSMVARHAGHAFHDLLFEVQFENAVTVLLNCAFIFRLLIKHSHAGGLTEKTSKSKCICSCRIMDNMGLACHVHNARTWWMEAPVDWNVPESTSQSKQFHICKHTSSSSMPIPEILLF